MRQSHRAGTLHGEPEKLKRSAMPNWLVELPLRRQHSLPRRAPGDTP